MHLIDSHCHLDQLDLSSYGGDLTKALTNATSLGVKHFLNVCITLKDFPAVLKIAENYSNVYASLGLHPNERDIIAEPTTEELIALASHDKVIAIGETGLDYYRSTGDIAWQQERFRQHIRAAKKIGKPLIVHARQAKKDTIQILREEEAHAIGGIMHCFTEDWEMAQLAMDLNFYISFSGVVTFKNALEVQEVAKRIPLDKMLVETDSPYLAPYPYRGQPNEPAYVVLVADCIAKLRGTTLDVIAENTTQNFWRLFGNRAQYMVN